MLQSMDTDRDCNVYHLHQTRNLVDVALAVTLDSVISFSEFSLSLFINK